MRNARVYALNDKKKQTIPDLPDFDLFLDKHKFSFA
jgi:hypothetical protein